MEAVVRTGGKQYLVKQGDKILIEKTNQEVGAEIKFEDILMISDTKEIYSEFKLPFYKVNLKKKKKIKKKKIL